MTSEQKYESEDYQDAFDAGQKLLYENMEAGAVEIELVVDQRRDREVVEIVMPALLRWHDAAIHGEQGYRLWLHFVLSAPSRHGLLVFSLVLATVLFTLFVAVKAVALFSMSEPISIFLGAIPVVVAGFLFLCGAGWVVYLVQRVRRMLFRLKSYRETIKDGKVLVCSLGEKPLVAALAEKDAEIYKRYFPTVNVLKAEKLDEILAALRASDFNILHLVNDYTEEGRLEEIQSEGVDIKPLFLLSRFRNLDFVYLAGNIAAEKQEATFESIEAARIAHDFPLVGTIDRGTEFSSFLDQLLQEIVDGKFLANAWLAVRPQDASGGAEQPRVDPGPQAVVTL